jgi:Rps23 Pro-64 3,4-dihydroxylase Tpa1-like proline 4-hydroxylase
MSNTNSNSKRARPYSTPPPPPTTIINPTFFQQIEQLKTQFTNGKPYSYLVFHNLLNIETAKDIHTELGKLQGNLKETDLFRVYQTGDLANADDNDVEHVTLIPQLLNLRKIINSKEFKQAVEQITNCGPLSDVVDLSANVYAQGCHLLCHDDVIGTRKISYIIYVGDPDDEWTEQDGGRLQLYGSDLQTHMPHAEPSIGVCPTFNSLAMFVVEPGVSFHSVEEVFTPNKARCSLQGWFHAATTTTTTNGQQQSQVATLQHLLHGGNLHLSLTPATDVSLPMVMNTNTNESLSKQDLDELSSWINPLFLKSEYMEQIAAKCASEDGCVSLVQFLRNDIQDRLKQLMFPFTTTSSSSNNNTITTPISVVKTQQGTLVPGWNVIGPAHVQCFLSLDETTTTTTNPLQQQLLWLNKQMSRPSFTRYLQILTSVRVTKRRSRIRCFRAGSDYTVAYAHDEPTALDVNLCFVNDYSDDTARDVWASGDVGGFEMYLDKEDDGVGDVAVYARDQEAPGVVCIDPSFAVLSIVDRDPSRMRYIKYISKSAPSDRFDIASTYEFELLSSGEDEDDGQ